MEPPRSPDLAFQDQLLAGAYEQDEELHRIILESRQEYIRQEQLRLQKEQQKLHLKKCLAVPIARLNLWKRTTTLAEERECLHHILNILYILTHPDRDDDDIHVPVEWVEPVRDFLEKHLKPSLLYLQAYEACMAALKEK